MFWRSVSSTLTAVPHCLSGALQSGRKTRKVFLCQAAQAGWRPPSSEVAYCIGPQNTQNGFPGPFLFRFPIVFHLFHDIFW